MPKLTLEKDDSGLRITAEQALPSVAKDGDNYQVTFAVGSDSVVVKLSATALQNLGLQCVAHMPFIAPQLSVKTVEEAIRLPAYLLKELDDRSIQLLLRECQSDSLIDFLWYMKDVDLLKLMLRNLSARAAEMLMEDLDRTWRGKNPDNTLEINAKRGREAVQEILGIVRRLILESQIPDVLGVGLGAP